MEKKLDGKYNKNFNSFIGALEGAFEILDSEQKTSDLMGATGFAFRINLHPLLLPPGLDFPWGDELTYAVNRFGYACRSMRSVPSLPVYDVYKTQGHHLILKGIDEGKASVVWNIQGGYFGLVVGYNDEKEIYYVSGILDDEEGPREMAFSELGKGNQEALAVYQPTKKLIEDRGEGGAKAVLTYAIEQAEGPANKIRGYKVGLEAYGLWKEALLGDDEINPFGAAYNAQALAEARSFVPSYLDKIEKFFSDGALKEARMHYQTVANLLGEVAELFPFSWKDTKLPSSENLAKANGLIDQAGAAEAKGVAALKKVLG